ncbi:MAG TPA: nucleotidyltransferase family protein [Pyrinomonadaceae bacterium]|jgi:molybdenum cofactor cytidylyltransferase|nr:nucleotidyltransferase family protein [Pyrinomonadaceae bacterium]
MTKNQVAILILAAGGSSRLGRPKQLLEFRGKTLLRNAVEAAIGADADHITVVTSPDLEEAIKNDLKDLSVDLILNPDWQTGMSSSIRVGLMHIIETVPKPAAIVITLCDQPLVTAETLSRLITEYRESDKPIVASEYNDTVGVPALFGRSMFSELLTLTGDKGAKSLIAKHQSDTIRVPVPEAAMDIDTVGDFEAFTEG